MRGAHVCRPFCCGAQTEDHHDKFYVLELLANATGTEYYVWQRWGRAGTTGQSTLKGPLPLAAARAEFASKFKDKTKNVFGAGTFTPHSGKYTVMSAVPAASQPAPKRATPVAQEGVHLATTSSRLFVEEFMELSGDGESRGVPEVGDVVAVEDDDGATFTGTVVTVSSSKRKGGGGITVRDTTTGVEKRLTADDMEEKSLDVVESPRFVALWEAHQQRQDPAPDGVAYGDGLVPSALAAALTADVDRLLATEPEDYHPGTGTRVRDLVHPSLYPFVAGRSVRSGFEGGAMPTAARPKKGPKKPGAPTYDRFGRKYETSRYQWLPTPFQVDEHGGVTIPYYINNLNRDRHPALYTNLASLFAVALPLVESVMGYVDTTTFYDADVEDAPDEGAPANEAPATAVSPTSLRGRTLLVIPKIVEYRLGAGEKHEGVWHVEGMSHEHIVATCVYVLARDAALDGGDLCFKRAYTQSEASRLFWNVPQDRPTAFNDMVENGTVPIGRLTTPGGRLLVFPNSHIHRLTELAIAGAAAEARRRIIVFWVVDPAVTDMPSTRDVAPQQQAAFSHEEALAMRLELMEERKRHKQSLNVRAVSLCEH